jgi:hypothetical protein
MFFRSVIRPKNSLWGRAGDATAQGQQQEIIGRCENPRPKPRSLTRSTGRPWPAGRRRGAL